MIDTYQISNAHSQFVEQIVNRFNLMDSAITRMTVDMGIINQRLEEYENMFKALNLIDPNEEKE